MKTVMREKQWAEKYPDLGTSPLPTEPYICEEHFARERDLVFRRTWINVGRVEEVPKAGDWFVREVAICKVSVLVIRGSDGVVRGFHNVCSHRSNKLVLDERGSCPSHTARRRAYYNSATPSPPRPRAAALGRGRSCFGFESKRRLARARSRDSSRCSVESGPVRIPRANGRVRRPCRTSVQWSNSQ